MLEAFSQRLLSFLQLTRMALVFTAISNSLCTLLLSTRRHTPEGIELVWRLHWSEVGLVAMISIGLYGFGMSLNDIIDRRRDRQLAAHRPLPSGRIAPLTAHILCITLAAMALAAGAIFAMVSHSGWRSLTLVLWTGFLISFYNLAGKYLVASGLLTLGLIRFFHAVIPAPWLPLLWHPLLLFTHVTLLSAIAYAWEQKRPALTRLHWAAVILGVIGIDAAAIALVWLRSPASLWLRPGLALPLGLVAVFVLIGWYVRRKSSTRRQAGQRIMLLGLLWLIIYDSSFAWVYIGWRYALGLALLLPTSWALVQMMRWWAQLLLISQQPQFKRTRNLQ